MMVGNSIRTESPLEWKKILTTLWTYHCLLIREFFYFILFFLFSPPTHTPSPPAPGLLPAPHLSGGGAPQTECGVVPPAALSTN